MYDAECVGSAMAVGAEAEISDEGSEGEEEAAGQARLTQTPVNAQETRRAVPDICKVKAALLHMTESASVDNPNGRSK